MAAGGPLRSSSARLGRRLSLKERQSTAVPYKARQGKETCFPLNETKARQVTEICFHVFPPKGNFVSLKGNKKNKATQGKTNKATQGNTRLQGKIRL